MMADAQSQPFISQPKITQNPFAAPHEGIASQREPNAQHHISAEATTPNPAFPVTSAQPGPALYTATTERHRDSDAAEEFALGAGAPLAAPAECAFCGLIGSPRTCGSLASVRLGDQEAAVHPACALWAPQVYQREGSDAYMNLESEWARAQHRLCSCCGEAGAAVTCTHASCRAVYHLPCAVQSTDVVLDKPLFELWCPRHAVQESDDEYGAVEENRGKRSYRRANSAADDEDFSPGSQGARPRRVAAQNRRHRFQREPGGPRGNHFRETAAAATAAAAAVAAASDRAQRPRTDWQRQGDAWVKVVPPWWCEHRTVHFANKVFRELFCGATSALLVDANGTEWDCTVSCETRNDLRLQYTLRGQFHDYWDVAGVQSGDVLTFERNHPEPGKIRVGRYPQGQGLEAALATAVQSKPPSRRDPFSSVAAVLPPRWEAQQAQQPLPPLQPLPSVQSSHPNRWTELADGAAIKTVFNSTLTQQQCPVAGWLYRKLYGRYPGDSDAAPMHDPTLGIDFLFEVAFVTAANVHYLTGRAFAAWMLDAGVESGDQIKLWKEERTERVMICRVPGSGVISTCGAPAAAGPWKRGSDAGAPPAPLPPPQRSPPSAEALTALNALAGAARYAAQHGTPAIQAVLTFAAEHPGLDGAALEEKLVAAGVPPPPSPFIRKRKALGEAEPPKSMPAPPAPVWKAPAVPAAASALPPPPSGGGPLLTVSSRPVMQHQPPGMSPTAQQFQMHQALKQLLQQCQAQQQALRNAALPPPLPPMQFPSSSGNNGAAASAAANNVSAANWPCQQQGQSQQSQGAAAFTAVMQALGRHQWTPVETALILRFRAKYSVMDVVGREVASLSMMQLQSSKKALLEVVKGIVNQAPQAAAPAGTPAPAPAPAPASFSL